ncbi:hypothetical protein B0I35DRAFT_484484 [Stachybotrys elegans]|uniref:LysM domain-containing protein n=1 Tax=Stachybotrys elegans TaxID=80388 RepID=A0A8K0WKT0_9HYPO|nr:hypothetical protein B0I35DRAFT_484484 [Stachybotrys elegans]
MLRHLLFLGLCVISLVHAQSVTLLNITAPYEGFSASCISLLNQALACNKKLVDFGRGSEFYSEQTLTDIRYKTGQASILASFIAQSVLEKYSVICLKSSEDKFCNAILSSAVNAAASGTATPTVASSLACHPCAASVLSTQLQLPIGNAQTELKSQYASLTSSCKITGKTITPLATTTNWVEIIATAAPTCTGTTYTIKSGDNCRSIAVSQGISTTNLLLGNQLQGYCINFPKSGSLCIPAAMKCKPYQLNVDLSDDCQTIAKANGATWAQIVSWNPELGQYCDNINRLAQDGQVICVSQPGGDYIDPNPEPEPTPTTSTETYFTLPQTGFDGAPKPTWSAAYPMAGYVDIIANKTFEECYLHRSPPVQVNESSSEDSYRCSDYADFYGITMTQLLEWNPSLKERTKDNDCTLWAGEQYCAQRDLASSAKMAKACIRTAVAETGPRSFCDGFVNWYGLPKQVFVDWNSGVETDCSSFRSGQTYCTGVYKFRPSNTISTCTRFHVITDNDMKTDPCGTVEAKYGLQHARFVAWNPTVQSNCSGIRVGYEYCVGTPQFPGTGG